MDGRGRAIDNVFTACLWHSLKYKEVYLKDYASPREARTGIAGYLDFFYHRRLHRSLDCRTPGEYISKWPQRRGQVDEFIALAGNRAKTLDYLTA
jgi:hypothetical protein